MNSECNTDTVIEILRRSLEGSSVDTAELTKRIRSGVELKDLGLDSLDLVDYQLRLEDTFDVEIPLYVFEQLSTFTAIAAYIREQKGSDSP